MDITPVVSESTQHIQRYGDGAFTISGKEFHGSVIVTPEGTMPWTVTTIDALDDESLAPVTNAKGDVDILLLGCGESAARVSEEIRQMFRFCGMNVDVMDTGGACRTYNILMQEGRRVMAALIAV